MYIQVDCKALAFSARPDADSDALRVHLSLRLDVAQALATELLGALKGKVDAQPSIVGLVGPSTTRTAPRGL